MGRNRAHFLYHFIILKAVSQFKLKLFLDVRLKKLASLHNLSGREEHLSRRPPCEKQPRFNRSLKAVFSLGCLLETVKTALQPNKYMCVSECIYLEIHETSLYICQQKRCLPV